MNNTLFFVVCIVAIVMCAKIIQTYLEQKSRKADVDEDLQDTLAKIDTLEQRVQVLERIITEHSFDLKKEIDNL